MHTFWTWAWPNYPEMFISRDEESLRGASWHKQCFHNPTPQTNSCSKRNSCILVSKQFLFLIVIVHINIQIQSNVEDPLEHILQDWSPKQLSMSTVLEEDLNFRGAQAWEHHFWNLLLTFEGVFRRGKYFEHILECPWATPVRFPYEIIFWSNRRGSSFNAMSVVLLLGHAVHDCLLWAKRCITIIIRRRVFGVNLHNTNHRGMASSGS